MVDRRRRLLKTLSGHSFRVKKNLQRKFFSFKTVYSRKFQITAEQNAPSSDLPFGTVLAKLKLFHVVEKNVQCETFEINYHL